jgi:hypothetical protein
MKKMEVQQMEVIVAGDAASNLFCGLTIIGWGVSVVSLVAAPNPLSAVGYSLATASLASCFV